MLESRMAFKIVPGVIVLMLSIISSTCAVPQCACPQQYAPVCGSNGQVYPNRCLLDCTRSILQRDIQVIKEGPCEAPSVMPTAAGTLCACERNLSPVCGTDGVTYSNICLLRCERRKKPTLEVRVQGPCLKRSKRAILYGHKYNMQRRNPCSFEY